MRIQLALASLLCAFAFSGCATITTGDSQQVSLQAQAADGQPVEKAECTLQNDKGSWKAEAPAIVTIRRSAQDLTVQCKKEGLADGFLRAVSRVKAAMFGNVLVGGGIGAFVDHTTGSAYNYPDDLPVKMGQNVTIDRRDEFAPKQTAQADASAGETQATTTK
jgi:hypothetical protein